LLLFDFVCFYTLLVVDSFDYWLAGFLTGFGVGLVIGFFSVETGFFFNKASLDNAELVDLL
jgi:hypothetical protein